MGNFTKGAGKFDGFGGGVVQVYNMEIHEKFGNNTNFGHVKHWRSRQNKRFIAKTASKTCEFVKKLSGVNKICIVHASKNRAITIQIIDNSAAICYTWFIKSGKPPDNSGGCTEI